MNLVGVRLTEDGVLIMGTTIPLSREIVGSATQRGLNSVTLGFRPEDVTLTMSEDGIPIEVQIVEELGPDAYIYGTLLSDGKSHQIVGGADGRRHPIQRRDGSVQGER